MLYNVGCTCNFVYIKGHGWVGWGVHLYPILQMYLYLLVFNTCKFHVSIPLLTCLYLCLPVLICVLPVFTCVVYLYLPVFTCSDLYLPVFTCLYLSLPVFTCVYLQDRLGGLDLAEDWQEDDIPGMPPAENEYESSDSEGSRSRHSSNSSHSSLGNSRGELRPHLNHTSCNTVYLKLTCCNTVYLKHTCCKTVYLKHTCCKTVYLKHTCCNTVCLIKAHF